MTDDRRSLCAACGRYSHRYDTSSEHPDRQACINGLVAELGRAERALITIGDVSIEPSVQHLAWQALADMTEPTEVVPS